MNRSMEPTGLRFDSHSERRCAVSFRQGCTGENFLTPGRAGGRTQAVRPPGSSAQPGGSGPLPQPASVSR